MISAQRLMHRFATLPTSYKVLIAIAAVFFISVSLTHSTFAALNTNSRLHYGNVWSYCDGGTAFAKGMVWLSNDEGDYYSETVNVATDATSVRVSIRGAVNSCRTNFSPGRDMYAINVSASVLTGLSGNSFYRGYVAGTWNWTTVGSKLYGDVNVSGIATCSPANLTGQATGTVVIYLTRQQQQWQNGRVVYTSPDPGTEAVPVNIVRTCPTYNYSLTPTIGITDGQVIEDPATAFPVTGSVRNNGPTNSRNNIDYQLTKVRYGPGATIPQKTGGTRTSGPSVGPCDFVTGEATCDRLVPGSGSQSYYPRNDVVPHAGSTTIDSYPVGTQICFLMSVRQYTHTTDNWIHSNISCLIVGKSPKVNILGGDLFVGRTMLGATAPVSARVVTTNSLNSTGIYGSWAEYAIAPTGRVSNMASGSGYAEGDADNTNLLTFVNTGNTAAPCSAGSAGCYQHGSSIPDIAARFRTASATGAVTSGSLSGRASGIYTGTGAIDISASTIEAGRSVIINAGDADVTISGNIEYAAGPFTSAAELPQLVIIARNITINEGVERVDAWLIAPGVRSGATMTNGVIRTCNRAPATINSGNCNRLLTINGPVIANRLLMLRSGGSEPGNRRGEPAEVFNFRPDAYIWAMQQAQTGGRVTTVSTKELPPRY